MSLYRVPLALRLAFGLLLVTALSMVLFYVAMRPPLSDFNLMVLFLGGTATVSELAVYAAHRLGWLVRTPSLRLALVGGYGLASLLTFFNVWVTARLMFTSQHDLELATILLVFAGGTAMLLAYFLSGGITRRIEALQVAARRLAAGDLAARAPLEGRDEVAALAASFNDMAQKLQAADARQRQLDALRRELVAWATHDLQTPLTAIRVQLDALADGMVDDAETTQRYLRTTRRQVNDLSMLIDDLFQVAQIDAGGLVIQPALCSLTDLLAETLDSFSALARERGVTLRGLVEPDIDPVRLDAPRVARLLNNLVGNALCYTSAGGSVTVSARRTGVTVYIEVADTGEGISPDDLPHIFERFYRGDKSRNRGTGGAGLGLAIARGIARAHGGEIDVESRLGAGTTFRVRLPA